MKRLRIPKAIDVYNHGMNGIDTANQLRTAFTCYRPRNRKWWKPLFYQLLDTYKTNTYLIWKAKNESSNHRDYTKFFDILVNELLTIPLESEFPPVNPLRPVHTLEYLERPTYCAWGLKNRGDCVQEPLHKRKFGDEIINQSRLTQRPSQVKTGCKECSKALCTRKKCWDKWHAQK